jgi:CDP-diacylglycerol--serine O-phosphatidyltransferase
MVFCTIIESFRSAGFRVDSLADMVTSGVVPGYVMFFMLSNSQHEISTHFMLPYLGFIITMGSCYRLAVFNIDTRQTNSFIGLPTPANALFILSLPLVLKYSDSLIVLEILTNQWVLLIITLFSAYILNAEIPLFSLKIKSLISKITHYKLAFCCFLSVVVFFQYAGIPLVIICYVVLSIVSNKFY